ncbi:TrkH-domain-containing protein [Massarina eburnea CBS 473.64]|uniref:TrkH-domain-containing protein n=1 Tax=Massarina eburnea CBS 473.64 TaxID=1395130 RepID=A0A6A6RY46_9PLEO|nr:TrkH-domain-containing protein [Massarina eburnea CBS 473.64]
MGLQERWNGFSARHPESVGRLQALIVKVEPYVPPINFITVHYSYFIATTVVGAAIFWGASSPPKSISWWDSLFMTMSAMTGSGLNTVNVSQLTTFQQLELMILMMMGSQVLVSYFTIAFRKHIFEKRFEDIVEMEREKRKKTSQIGSVVGMTGAMFGLPVMSSFGKGRKPRSIKRKSDPGPEATNIALEDTSALNPQRLSAGRSQQHVGFLEPIREGKSLDEPPDGATTGHSIYQVHSHQSHQSGSTRRRPLSIDSKTAAGFNLRTFVSEQKTNIGKKGQFFNLSSDEREYLGGVEYRSLKFLSFFVISYFLLWQLLGAITLGAYMWHYEADACAVNDQNCFWAGAFLAVSAYSNSGFTLLDAGFIPFQDSYFILTVVTILSLAGPAAFPVFIRLLIWIMSTLLNIFSKDKEYGVWKEGFDFILKFPRRVYTSMFAARDTWMFVLTFGGFVCLDWVLILILSIGNPTMDAIPLGQRIFISLFEGFSIPSGGYAIVSPSGMYFDVQVLWLVIFYTAAYPHIITMRKTNVYEERSLGIYEGDQAEKDQLHSPSSSVFDMDAELPTTTNNAAWDGASQTPSTAKIAGITRRGTAFVGRQVQRRMTAFQGVGVAHRQAPPPPNPLRRATTMDFSKASLHSLNGHPANGPPSLLSQQVRGQLSHDVWYVSLALFLITLIETHHSITEPVTYSVFNFMFEILSGYTNIGISIGLPDQSYSFSGGMYTGSKIIMILVMLRGRHRGLPVALDRAVRLPGKKLAQEEDEDAEIRSLGPF